jgi:hypothetical protein
MAQISLIVAVVIIYAAFIIIVTMAILEVVTRIEKNLAFILDI